MDRFRGCAYKLSVGGDLELEAGQKLMAARSLMHHLVAEMGCPS